MLTSAALLRNVALSFTLLLGSSSAFSGGCGRREVWPGPKEESPPNNPASFASGAPTAVSSSSGSEGLAAAFNQPAGPHPRILISRERLAVLARNREANASSWRVMQEACDQATRETLDAGYEVWDWAGAAMNLALCWKITEKRDYADAAIKYFTAMLDDRRKVGDGKGGNEVVRHDDGYPIRTHGMLGAILYDWLYDAPRMDNDLRKKAMDRFVAWIDWFKKKGYNNDFPIANYYVGYFGAVAFAGIATEGEDPRAADLRKQTQKMWRDELVPQYRKLAGGDFPEGWQYGDMVGAMLAIYADAEMMAHPVAGSKRAKALIDEMPWLRETVAYHANALLPDGKHCWDTGDWDPKPAVMPPHTLQALALVLPSSEPQSRQALALAKLARDDSKEEWKWLQALADDPGKASEDPRRGATSYLAKGTGTVLARTDWNPSAVFAGISSAPSLSDHQHLDAGHFGIVRGNDWLLVDGGGYGNYSSLSHNVIAVDDRKENLNYSPSQGTWSDTASITRYEDEGQHVYALAEYTSAYNPAGYPKDHPRRSVTRAEREWIFSRAPVSGMGLPTGRVVIYDRMTVTKPSYVTTFLAHGGATPEVKGNTARITVGRSAAWVTTLLPASTNMVVVNEPTPKGEGPFYANEPPEGVKQTRIEVAFPKSATVLERRFLHTFVVGPSADKGSGAADKDKAPAAVRIEGEMADGAALDNEAYIFTSVGDQVTAGALSYKAPMSAGHHLVMGLAPEGKYAVTAAAEGTLCKVSLAPGGTRGASKAGVIEINVVNCALGK